jgi:hypothetical protein
MAGLPLALKSDVNAIVLKRTSWNVSVSSVIVSMAPSRCGGLHMVGVRSTSQS